MNLQEYFNLNRFWLYLKHDLKLYKKKYLGFILSFILVLFLIDLFVIEQNLYIVKVENNYVRTFRTEIYQVVFLLTLLMSWVLVIGSSFLPLRKRSSTINYLLLPVSLLEKVLVQFIIRVVVFTCLFVFLYWIEFKLALSIIYLFEDKQSLIVPSFGVFDFFEKSLIFSHKIIIILSLFSVTSFLFAATTYFQKRPVLNTVLALGVLVLLAFVFSVVMSHILLPDEVNGFEMKIFDRELPNKWNTIQICLSTIGVMSSLFFFPIAYFKLKEKEA
ncbi:hypothetical protein [Flavivirga jejuensis]|uniref:ABC transporter permease n=1 Tax=Flavivirga jejuensis TaxID=870487 RepID=A0ABT8WMF6_9FLAO|nr:hypothetical protein [Flavivirga jejuensis]MDO5974338.1 hypothetical protein [Flavivirga jejuensis]